MNRPLDRSFYIPKNSKEIKNGDAVAYTYSMDGNPVAMGFYGKTKKPVFHYRFKSPERMQEYIDKFFSDRKEHFVRKAEAKAKRESAGQEMANNAKVGDIYYSSWGYDQTNIDFYQIVAKKGKMSFMLQKIGSMISRHTDWGVDYVMPNPKHTKGEPMLKRMTEYGFNLNSYSSAVPWGGEEKSETSFGWGH
tara:strand:- start:1253 stop:1828 length:576 start_codon:yes stop_codon:yes gene_type:complete